MDESMKGSREQHWSELNYGEKVERVREEVKRLEIVVSEMRTQMYKFSKHLHVPDGEIVTKLSNDGIPMSGNYRTAAADGDDVYF